MKSFDLEKQLAEESPEDWVFGALSEPGLVSIPLAERFASLPLGEVQRSSAGDFRDCASRTLVNHIEALITYYYHHGMKAANKEWLKEKGYVVLRDGKEVVEFSDRFIAILSGTTKNGNSLKAPVDAIYRYGLIPKVMLPKGEHMEWEEYHDPNSITQAMKDLGAEFRKRLSLNYEKVHYLHFAETLKDDMVGVAGYGWPFPQNGIYERDERPPNHAFLLYALPAFQVYDSYYEVGKNEDFTKNLAPNYKFYEWGYRMYLSADTTAEERTIQTTVFDNLSKYGLLSFFASWWQHFTKKVKGI